MLRVLLEQVTISTEVEDTASLLKSLENTPVGPLHRVSALDSHPR